MGALCFSISLGNVFVSGRGLLLLFSLCLPSDALCMLHMYFGAPFPNIFNIFAYLPIRKSSLNIYCYII